MALVSTRSSANAPPASRTKIQAAAITIIRWVSDPRMIVLSRPSGGFVEAVSEAADCGDDIGPKLLPYAGDENLDRVRIRSEEHTSELQSLMRISYAVFCLKKKNTASASHMTHT